MSVHSVRNINLFFPQMNQSKETHFQLFHPHNKLVRTLQWVPKQLRKAIKPKSKMATNNYIRIVIFMWSMRRFNMHQARLNFFSQFLFGRDRRFPIKFSKFAKHSQDVPNNMVTLLSDMLGPKLNFHTIKNEPKEKPPLD